MSSICNNNISITFSMKENYKCPEDVTKSPKDFQRISRGCPRGIQRGPKDLQRKDWGCKHNAYISMSRNHNDSDLVQTNKCKDKRYFKEKIYT